MSVDNSSQTMTYSAIIIARNEEKHIRKTVQSLLNQTIKPYKIVIVDDGSADNTADIGREMGATVIGGPAHEHGRRVYYDTLSKVRNIGLEAVLDDPVDWIYSGDADIILPPSYCETIMRHAGKCGAYVAAGIEKGQFDKLPMEGCLMFRRRWVQVCDIRLKWESVYLCFKAMSHGHYTMVRHHDDCTVTPQRPTGVAYTIARRRGQGGLMRRMGTPLPYMVWKMVGIAMVYGWRTAWVFFKGWRENKVDVPDEMRRIYGSFIYDHLKTRIFGRFGIKSDLFRKDGDNLVCGPATTRSPCGMP